MEEEYRYLINILPLDPNITTIDLPSRYSKNLEEKIPPSINCYFRKISENAWKSMKIVLGPKSIEGDWEIVESLIHKYNPHANLELSKLKGHIR